MVREGKNKADADNPGLLKGRFSKDVFQPRHLSLKRPRLCWHSRPNAFLRTESLFPEASKHLERFRME